MRNCLAGNVRALRGEGVIDSSIKALQLLDGFEYGLNPALPLTWRKTR